MKKMNSSLNSEIYKCFWKCTFKRDIDYKIYNGIKNKGFNEVFTNVISFHICRLLFLNFLKFSELSSELITYWLNNI